MSYRDNQCAKALKLRNELFNNDPGGGIHNGHAYDFVLQNSVLNLWDKIRDDAIQYFEDNEIEWHNDGKNKIGTSPEGHLLSSNIACINHLFYIRQRQDFATAVLKNIDGRIISAKEIAYPDKEAGYVAFEINGKENWLGERSHTRGALSTSIDAVMLGEKNDGKNILVLIEWKYTEHYTSTSLYKPTHEIIYGPLLYEKSCPVKIEVSSHDNFKALYYEPFYQLMRQTLLGWKMVQNHEYDCDEFVHIHVIPDENKELLNNVTAPVLSEYGNTICKAWKGALKEPDHYKIISPKRLLEPLKDLPDASDLMKYLDKRYWKTFNNFSEHDLSIIQKHFHKLIIERAQQGLDCREFLSSADKNLPIITNETEKA